MRPFRKVREAFDWRTFAVAGAFLSACMAAFIIRNGAQAVHDSSVQQSQLRAAASRRIDLLSKQIDTLEASLNTAAADRGRLLSAIDALTAQVRQLGGDPVIVVHAPRAAPTAITPNVRPTPKTTSTSRPTVRSAPHPKPQPTPTARACIKVGPICLKGAP